MPPRRLAVVHARRPCVARLSPPGDPAFQRELAALRRLLPHPPPSVAVPLFADRLPSGWGAVVAPRRDVTLDAWVARHGPNGARLAREHLCQMAEAVAFAHRRGLVHGRVRPRCFWLDTELRLQLGGWGRGVSEPAPPGADPYRAPEGVAGTRAGDLWGLGATAAFSLLGALDALPVLARGGDAAAQLLRRRGFRAERFLGFLGALLAEDPRQRRLTRPPPPSSPGPARRGPRRRQGCRP